MDWSLKGAMSPSSLDELVVYSRSNEDLWEIVGLREVNLIFAIIPGKLDLLSSSIWETGRQVSLLDLAVRFGHAEFASMLASLGIGFKGLTRDDLAIEHHSVAGHGDIGRYNDLFLPAVHAAISAVEAQPSLAEFLWCDELPLLNMLLELPEDLVVRSYALKVAKLSLHVSPRSLAAGLLSTRQGGFTAYLKLLLDVGVDMCEFSTRFNGLPMSLLDGAIDEGRRYEERRDEDVLVRFISAGLQSAEEANLGMLLVNGLGFLEGNEPSLSPWTIKVIASAGMDLSPLCVDLDRLAVFKGGQFAVRPLGKWSLLRVAIMFGQTGVAGYLSAKGCVAPDLTAMDMQYGLPRWTDSWIGEERDINTDWMQRLAAADLALNTVRSRYVQFAVCQWAHWWERQTSTDISRVAVKHAGVINSIVSFVLPVPLHALSSLKHDIATSKIDDSQAAVIELVLHEDGIAEAIHPQEATAVTDQIWASSVEHLLAGGSALSPATAATGPEDSISRHVTILKFSRHSEELDFAILQSPPAQAAAANGIDTQPAWARGAKILAEVIEPDIIEASIGHWLKSHVVLYEDDLPSLHEALQHLPYQTRKLKPGEAGQVRLPDEPTQLSLMDVSSDRDHDSEFQISDISEPADGPPMLQDVIEYEVVHTFIHYNERADTRTVMTV